MSVRDRRLVPGATPSLSVREQLVFTPRECLVEGGEVALR